MSTVRVHAVIFAVWFLLALAIAIQVALLGNEESILARGRGSDLKARTDIAFQVDRLKSQLEVESSAPSLDEAIRRLGMPLQPPVRVAVSAIPVAVLRTGQP